MLIDVYKTNVGVADGELGRVARDFGLAAAVAVVSVGFWALLINESAAKPRLASSLRAPPSRRRV